MISRLRIGKKWVRAFLTFCYFQTPPLYFDKETGEKEAEWLLEEALADFQVVRLEDLPPPNRARVFLSIYRDRRPYKTFGDFVMATQDY